MNLLKTEIKKAANRRNKHRKDSLRLQTVCSVCSVRTIAAAVVTTAAASRMIVFRFSIRMRPTPASRFADRLERIVRSRHTFGNDRRSNDEQKPSAERSIRLNRASQHDSDRRIHFRHFPFEIIQRTPEEKLADIPARRRHRYSSEIP